MGYQTEPLWQRFQNYAFIIFTHDIDGTVLPRRQAPPKLGKDS